MKGNGYFCESPHPRPLSCTERGDEQFNERDQPSSGAKSEKKSQGEGVETIEHGLPAELLARARKLRKCQTDAEALLWQLVRNRQLENWKFRRQHPISPGYILDFYCAETKVAVELDGAGHSHELQNEYDVNRTATLSEFGIRVIRFSNEEVLEHPDDVLIKIIDFSSS